MDKRGPQMGKCLCGSPATIRETKAADGRLHFMCQDLTPEGKSKHYGFVDRSEEWRLEAESEHDETWFDDARCRRLSPEEVPGAPALDDTSAFAWPLDAQDCTCEKCKAAGKGAYYRAN